MDLKKGTGQTPKSMRMAKKAAIVTALDLKSKADETCQISKETGMLGTMTRGKRRKAQQNNDTGKKNELKNGRMSDNSNHDETVQGDLTDCENHSKISDEEVKQKKATKTVDVGSELEFKKKTETVVNIANVRNRKRNVNDNSGLDDMAENSETNEMETSSESKNAKKSKLEPSIPRISKRKKTLPRKRITVKGKNGYGYNAADENKIEEENIGEDEVWADLIEKVDEEEQNTLKRSRRKNHLKVLPLCDESGTEAVENDKDTESKSDSMQNTDKTNDVSKGVSFGCVEKYTIGDGLVSRVSITCDCCGSLFESLTELKEHLQEKFDVETKDINIERICECTYEGCSKKFSCTSNCRRHMTSVHVSERKYTCEFCAFSFKRYSGLSSHINALHSKEGDYKFECEVCGKCFRRKAGLVMHSSIHTDDKHYICGYENCGKQFRLQTTLYKHEKCVHSGVKPYECETCGERFTRKTYLRSHMYKHTGVKGYKCDVCFKSFTQKGNLMQHVKALHGKKKKTYECPQCAQTFNFKSNLTKHLSKHDYHDSIEILANYSDYEMNDFDQEEKDIDVKKAMRNSRSHQKKNTEMISKGTTVSDMPPLRNLNKHVYLSFDKRDKFLIMNPIKTVKKKAVMKPLEQPTLTKMIQRPVAFTADQSEVQTGAGNIQIFVVEQAPSGSSESNTIEFAPSSMPQTSATIDNKAVHLNVVGQGNITKDQESLSAGLADSRNNCDGTNETMVTGDPVDDNEMHFNDGSPVKKEVCVTYVTSQSDVTRHGDHESSATDLVAESDETVGQLNNVNVKQEINSSDEAGTVYVTDSSVINALEVILGSGEQQLLPTSIISKPSAMLSDTCPVSSAFNNENVIQGSMQLTTGIGSTVVDIIDFTPQSVTEMEQNSQKSE